MNTTDIRQAILMAADKIERFPEQFDFGELCVPRTPSGCGCALGWIGYFSDVAKGYVVSHVGKEVLGTDDCAFYKRMRSMECPGETWSANAFDCAACLRRYADIYHPGEPEQPFVRAYLPEPEWIGGAA